MKILFVGGGSVGHIAPSIAVWEKLQSMKPDLTAHFVCDEREDDKKFLMKMQYEYTALAAPRFSWSFPWKFFTAAKEARRILEAQQPSVIFSTGGYVSVPLCYSAYTKKIPIVLFEADAVSGRANRIIGDFAAEVCLGFPERKEGPHRHITGYPVRAAVIIGTEEEGRRISGFSGSKPVLLIMGGSQGAQSINEVIASSLTELTTLCDVIHITGAGKKVQENGPGYWSREFVNEELAHLYAITDLALSRAGAGSIAELAANGIPAILVPLQGVAHDHQVLNAKQAEKLGAAVVLKQNELATRLVPFVQSILADQNRQNALQNGMKLMFKPDAALQISEIISQTLDQAK